MSSETARTGTARMAADLSVHDAGSSLAGLIDVLDRLDGVAGKRTPGRRPAAHRPAGSRSGAVRTVPLRSVQPAPMARPALAPFASAPAARPASAPSPAPAPAETRPSLSRRAALWGAGVNGEYLAWRPAAPRHRRPPVLRDLIRRLALWGAGSKGEYLAWGGAPGRGAGTTAPARPTSADVDPPVVLRELPSTPTNRSAAPSPAAATGTTAPRVERWVRPGTAGRLPVRLPAPPGPVPSRARSPVGIRGSPGTAPARGSPPWWPEPG
jgi:hypothetical protein